jgi:hypothetical protein
LVLTLTLRLEPLGSIKPLVLPIRPYFRPPPMNKDLSKKISLQH